MWNHLQHLYPFSMFYCLPNTFWSKYQVFWVPLFRERPGDFFAWWGEVTVKLAIIHVIGCIESSLTNDDDKKKQTMHMKFIDITVSGDVVSIGLEIKFRALPVGFWDEIFRKWSWDQVWNPSLPSTSCLPFLSTFWCMGGSLHKHLICSALVIIFF